MKAIVRQHYGSEDVLQIADIDPPIAGVGEVLVRVQAAGVDPGVWHLMTGLPQLVRLAYGVRAPKNPVLGSDVAGRIEAVGANVTKFQVGDEVFGVAHGSYADVARARVTSLAHKPVNLSFVQAAAVPISACTALQGLRDKGRIQAGQKVLVVGAGGGVGTFAVQLAKSFGAEVTGVCSTAKADRVASLGADHVIDYTRDEVVASDRRYDLILDIAGNASLSRSKSLLSEHGTLVLVGGEGGGRWFGGSDRQLRAAAISPFIGSHLRSLLAVVKDADLEVLRKLIEAGRVRPIIDRTFAFAEAPDSIRYLRSGRAFGKIVITVGAA